MRRPGLIPLMAVVLLAASCKQEKVSEAPRRITPIDPAPLVEAHNARVAELDRFWARGIVAVRYTDEDGDRKYQQGDSHLQRLDADRLALSITKLGETYLWLGSDADRYWVFDLVDSDNRRLFVGRRDLATPEKAARAGLPVLPDQWLVFAGLRPFDQPAEAFTAGVAADGERILWIPRDDDLLWLMYIDTVTGLPTRVVLAGADRRPILRSTLQDYRSVRITGRGGDYPKLPSKILLEHVESGASINAVIDGDIVDGRRSGKPKPAVFDLEFLSDALGPIDMVVDLDEPLATVE